jgi:hypothetical protein
MFFKCNLLPWPIGLSILAIGTFGVYKRQAQIDLRKLNVRDICVIAV